MILPPKKIRNGVVSQVAKPMKTITIKLDDQEVEVKKLPIGEYAEIFKAVKQLPKHFRTLENLTNDKIIEILPEIIGDCLPDVIGILSEATKMPGEEIEKLGLDEITKLVVGIFEVNNYSEIYKLLKKVTAHPAVKKEIQANRKTN